MKGSKECLSSADFATHIHTYHKMGGWKEKEKKAENVLKSDPDWTIKEKKYRDKR